MQKLFYGIELFGLELCKAFQTTFNKIVRITSGATQSSPVISLVVEAGELPLHLRMSETLIKRYCRIEEKSGSDHQYLHEAANAALYDQTGHEIPNIAKLHRKANRPWYQSIKVDRSIQQRFKKGQNSNTAISLVHDLLHTKYSEHDKLYTDGSKCDNHVGIGVVGNNTTIESS